MVVKEDQSVYLSGKRKERMIKRYGVETDD